MLRLAEPLNIDRAYVMCGIPDVDGALVGGASLSPDFIAIVRAFAESVA
jgi:triosephosphate isomerase